MARSAAGTGQGDFFAVDRRAWARACGLGLNPAVAYLVLARGTGADNRTTTWSVQAVESYTGVSRGRAHDALKRLQLAGLVRVLREGTRPKYRLMPAHEVSGCEGCPLAPALDEGERRLLDLLRQGERHLPNRVSEDWGHRNLRTMARDLVCKGVARELAGFRFAVDDRAPSPPHGRTGSGCRTPWSRVRPARRRQWSSCGRRRTPWRCACWSTSTTPRTCARTAASAGS